MDYSFLPQGLRTLAQFRRKPTYLHRTELRSLAHQRIQGSYMFVNVFQLVEHALDTKLCSEITADYWSLVIRYPGMMTLRNT